MSDSRHIEPKLYRHVSQTDWGYGVLAYEDGDRRKYQFQDGKIHIIARGYFDRIREAENPPKDARHIIAELSRDLDASRARARIGQTNPSVLRSVRSLDEQIELFKGEFPEGFGDPAWQTTRRGAGNAKHAKRHRDPLLASAAPLFSREALAEDGNAESWLASVISTLKSSDLVRAAPDLDKLRVLSGTEGSELRYTLFSAVHGGDDFRAHFDRVLRCLDPRANTPATWPLSTILFALAAPKRYVVVRPSSFRIQARFLAPAMVHADSPSGALYAEYASMARSIDRSLLRAGMQPKDLFDVYDFILLTAKLKK